MPAELPPGGAWLRENWDSLRENNFEWVAAGDAGLIAHARELEAVIDEVVAQGCAEQAVYALLDFDAFDG